MVTKTKPISKAKQKKQVAKQKPKSKPKSKPKPKSEPEPEAKKTTQQKIDEFVDTASKIGSVAGSANSVVSLLESTGLLEKIKKALQDKKREDETTSKITYDLLPANVIEPPPAVFPVAQPVVPISQPVMPVSQPVMPVAEKDEFFTPRSSVSENVYTSITQLKLL